MEPGAGWNGRIMGPRLGGMGSTADGRGIGPSPPECCGPLPGSCQCTGCLGALCGGGGCGGGIAWPGMPPLCRTHAAPSQDLA